MNEILSSIKVLVSDVDGVLTDSSKAYDREGNVIHKTFCDLDTLGMRLAERLGAFEVVLMSGDDRVNKEFAAAHGVEFIHTGYCSKVEALDELLAKRELLHMEVGFIGNDLNDAEAMDKVVSFAPGDCLDYMYKFATYELACSGGAGAFREVVDMILEAKGFNVDDMISCLPKETC
jgi:3-deoxy-D-manno-octulosonate 8-phosphate phosphatase (KDO 8-P phosphatase)